MKRLIYIATIIVLMSSCIRARTIPDEKLADIFCDMYIANAYVNENAYEFGGRRLAISGYAQNRATTDMDKMDSINIYEPILRNYGYRTRDFVHTLANFSKRKSAKIGDVVEAAIKKLDAELALYGAQVARIESLDSAAYANTADTIARDVNLKARTIADTAKLKLTYAATDGHYRVEYSYALDTLDKNPGLRATHYLRDSTGMVVGQNSYVMFRGVRTRYSMELNSSSVAEKLELKFGNYIGRDLKRPYLDVDSIIVIHYPPKETAREIYLKKLINFDGSGFIFEPQAETETETENEK